MRGTIARSAARGVVAAMAMTGMRRVTSGLGLLEQAPPETIAEQAPGAARLVDRVPPEHRDAVIELGHWGVGAAGGAIFGALGPAVVRSRWAGSVYGLGILGVFETTVVPLLGLQHARQRKVMSRVLLAADHVLYGLVLSSGNRPRKA